MIPGSWQKARTPAEAIALRRGLGPSARYMAGGTALQLNWPEGCVDHPVVDIGDVIFGPDVSIEKNRLLLSAAARLEDLRCDPTVIAVAPAVSAAIGSIGAIGVRNLATLGGNLAWLAGDLVPLLLVLGAKSIGFERGSRGLADMLSDPGDDLLLAVEIPLPLPGRVCFEKVTARAAFAPSLITIAASFSQEGPLLAIGGGPVAPALVDVTAEEHWSNHSDAGVLAQLISTRIDAPDDDFSSGRYRARAASNLLAAFLCEEATS